jgi:hypothetical protein
VSADVTVIVNSSTDITVQVTEQPVISVTVAPDAPISVVTVGTQGPAGPQGAQGEIGPPGTTTWDGITDKPSTFTPTAHGNESHTSVFVTTTDPRLSDARTPTAHSLSHQSGGTDVLNHNSLGSLNSGNYLHLTAAEKAPIDGKTYGRKNGAWAEVPGGGGGTLATVTGTLDFGAGGVSAQVAVSYPAITATTVISTIEYTNKLEEVLIQDMKIKEVSRSVGVGFTAMGFAPQKAAGTYNFRAIIQE